MANPPINQRDPGRDALALAAKSRPQKLDPSGPTADELRATDPAPAQPPASDPLEIEGRPPTDGPLEIEGLPPTDDPADTGGWTPGD
jgi:hypothetical protein